MMVAIHQPNYLPYLGIFNKMKNADIFVIYDDAQFTKKGWIHRNRIRIYEGWKWLGVPVEKEEKPIREIKIENEIRISGMEWSKYHWRQIHANYAGAECFDEYADELKRIYNEHYEKLVDLNMRLIEFLMLSFRIDVELVYSSEFGLDTSSSQKNLDLVKAVGGDVYLSGVGGCDYLDVSLFEKEGVEVVFQHFKHPIYKQRFPGFEPNMAAIDLLFNMGEKSKKMIYQ